MIIRIFGSNKTNRKRRMIGIIAMLGLSSLFIESLLSLFTSTSRRMSIDLGDGNCIWTDSIPISTENPYGTLFASYPASGMRKTWQQAEGLTGIQMIDDFFQLSYPKVGLVKTQYPHYEGIWSYAQNMDQVIMLIRNPRWAIPSYHTLLSELNYAHSWELAYDHLPAVFTRRAPMEDWTKWRDYRFEDEIVLWGLQIDFWMSNGTKYWMDYDFERNGQWPFHFLNSSEKTQQDIHCAVDCDCVPKAIVAYERLTDPITGPSELRKIANVIRGKQDMTVINNIAIDCIWHETWINAPAPSNEARDANGLPAHAYNFTMSQLESMEAKLIEFRDKYSSGSWTNNSLAQDLVRSFEDYLDEVSAEIVFYNNNPPTTPAPYAGYENEIQDWYNSKGKGNRYDKAKIQKMGIWHLISHFYDEEE